jgi:hypothetical protein
MALCKGIAVSLYLRREAPLSRKAAALMMLIWLNCHFEDRSG